MCKIVKVACFVFLIWPWFVFNVDVLSWIFTGSVLITTDWSPSRYLVAFAWGLIGATCITLTKYDCKD